MNSSAQPASIQCQGLKLASESTQIEAFNRDITPLITAGGTVVAVIALVLLWRQLRATAKWNRLSLSMQMHDTERITRLTKEHHNTCRAIQVDARKDTISNSDATTIHGDADARIALNALINDCETFCASYQAKCIDREWAYNVAAARTIRFYQKYLAYITFIRTKRSDASLFEHLEATAAEWAHRRKRISMLNYIHKITADKKARRFSRRTITNAAKYTATLGVISLGIAGATGNYSAIIRAITDENTVNTTTFVLLIAVLVFDSIYRFRRSLALFKQRNELITAALVAACTTFIGMMCLVGPRWWASLLLPIGFTPTLLFFADAASERDKHKNWFTAIYAILVLISFLAVSRLVIPNIEKAKQSLNAQTSPSP